MRLVILGGAGMLGHILCARLSRRFPDTYTTICKGIEDYEDESLFGSDPAPSVPVLATHCTKQDFRFAPSPLMLLHQLCSLRT